MMCLDEVVNLNHEDDFRFAVAVGIDEDDFTHAALLYKWSDGKIRTIDFVSHQYIRSNYSIGDFGQGGYLYVFYNPELIIDDLAIQIPAVCELVKEQNSSISFGIKFSETKFDEHGKLVLLNGDFGLTCATFILAIFQRAGIPLINLSDWHARDEDIKWQNRVLEYYKEVNRKNPDDYSADLLNHFENNIGCFRYRPEEVASATAAASLPVGIDYCDNSGKRIVFALNNGIQAFYA